MSATTNSPSTSSSSKGAVENVSLSQRQIQSLLECTVCIEPCASPIYACKENGHLMCTFCYDKLKETKAVKCPLCQCSSFQISQVAERQSRQNDMRGNCQFTASGCDIPVLAATLKSHLKTCEYRDVKCTDGFFSRIPVKTATDKERGCNKTIALQDFPQHLIAVHKKALKVFTPLWGFHHSVTILNSYSPNPNDERSKLYWSKEPQNYTQGLIQHDGVYFAVHAARGNYMFYWWVTIFGGQKEADRYKYQTALEWKSTETGEDTWDDNFASFCLPVLPFHRYENHDKLYGNYAMVHAMTATACSQPCTGQIEGRSLRINVKISKSESITERKEDTGAIKRKVDATEEDKSKKKKTTKASRK